METLDEGSKLSFWLIADNYLFNPNPSNPMKRRIEEFLDFVDIIVNV